MCVPMYVYIYIYVSMYGIYVYVCVCGWVSVCVYIMTSYVILSAAYFDRAAEVLLEGHLVRD